MLSRYLKFALNFVSQKYAQDPPPITRKAGSLIGEPSRGAQRTSRGLRILSLATATRDYARRLAAGTFDGAREEDIVPLVAAMGPDVWAWQRARRLADLPPWRAQPDADEDIERDIVRREMTHDLDTWEVALRRLDARIAQARLLRQPIPAPLNVPEEVADALARRREAARERAARRRRRESGDGSSLAQAPEEAAPPIPKSH
ncbi:hypothetical protein [Methylobacterium sp. Gmos1]